MALMFSRTAKNFVKNGYFPTDDATMASILARIELASHHGVVRVLDPCCGEGAALAQLSEFLLMDQLVQVESFGIEFDRERAWHAKSLAGQAVRHVVAHADINDVLVPPRSMGCLFLNPPYGDLIADRAETGSSKPFKSGRLRLEKMFFDRCIGSLQYGGLLILIVPYHVIDQEFASKIISHCDDVTWYLAPEQQFKQAVIMGTRVRVRSPQKSLVQSLVNFGQGPFPIPACSVLPKTYSVPQVNGQCELRVIRIDAAQLIDELDKLGDRTLWNQFSNQFGVLQQVRRRWLCEPSQWHLALALAAGQVYGAIQGQDGRTLLIKGDTIKEKDCVVEQSVDDQGNVTEKRVMTDKFVPIITGLDFTIDRDTFGQVVTIR